MKPKIAILRTDGTNCDEELFYAFEKAGGSPEMVHVNQLIHKEKNLKDYQILSLPGGFSYGDDILSGKILANELRNRLKSQLDAFIAENKLLIGICNGFQTLVRMGYLPWNMKPAEEVSLIFNDSGHFECRWIKIQVARSNCVFTKGLEKMIFDMPVAHGEGKFVVKNKAVGKKIINNNHVVFQYVNDMEKVTMDYPANPNGSFHSIAGITDLTGHILGLMPHPERNTLSHHHPNWRSRRVRLCNPIFENAVTYFK